jgi:integrase/recombinase XerD
LALSWCELPLWRDVEEFILDRRARNLSPATVVYYRGRLTRFAQYAASVKVDRTEDVTAPVLRAYLASLTSTHNSGGVGAEFRAVRAFLRWWAAEHDIDRPAIARVHPPRVRNEPLPPLSLEHLRALLAVCRQRTHSDDRDRALLLFLFDTGVRAGELAMLNVGDVDDAKGAVVVRHGKGDKQRTVYLGAKALKELKRYLRHRKRAKSDSPLFATVDGRRLNRYTLRQILRRRSTLAGIPRPSLHSFRRAFAINSLRNGMDVFALQKLMGHADLTVLRRYLAQTEEDLHTAHQQSGPVDRLL